MRDLRYALRMLLKSPGFTAVALLTLALGIGANTAIFTVVDKVLLSPLPYSDAGRLMLVSAALREQRGLPQVFSYLRFTFMLEHSRSFAGLAAFTNETFNVTGRGDPEQVPSARVSWNFFDVLGVRPALGRSFVASEDQPGGKQVVLISSGLWTRRFGKQSDAVGRTISLDSQDFTIIGVLPAGFVFPFLGANVDLWAPRVFELNLATPQQIRGGAGFLNAVARLGPGISQQQAQSEMDVLDRQYQHDNPGLPDADPRLSIAVNGLQSQSVANVRLALLVLLGAVGFVLLIACANVASLLLSRALGRKKEIAVRAALGAGRGLLLRQLLIESLVLAVAGGALGVLLSLWGTSVLFRMLEGTLPGIADFHMDIKVLVFTAGVSLLSGMVFGLIPALQLSSPDLNAVLRDEGRGSIGNRRRNNARNVLVVAEIALSMVLLVGSGLLIRSFIRLQTVSPGFDPNNVLTMSVSLPQSKYSKPQQMVAFYEETLRQLQNVPGVQAVAISSALPINPTRFSPVLVEGQPAVPLGQRPILNIQTISPDYAKVLRVPLLRGREFTAHDDAAAPAVAIVNQALARRFWPNENPIGKHLWLGRRTTPVEVAGVFGDIKNVSLAGDASPEVLLPFPQLPWALLRVSIRTAQDPRTVASAVRQKLGAIDKDQPVTRVQTLDEVLASATAQPRLILVLLGVFSATAFILAMVGIYGVISYTVAQRTAELGIRMALGANKNDILRLVLGHGAGLTGVGIVIGLVGSLALTRVMSNLLYQTPATDPVAFGVSAVLFTLVALAASYLPARRAVHIDPAIALR